jgi:endonuclease/exonuclease/phosphatase family metal-dependent hydrolase
LFTLPLSSQEKEIFRVMFWNVENLFDTERDSLKRDEEFTPASLRGWNAKRYKKKMADVSRVITAVGEWEPPALVGLCEVENGKVLHYLTRYSPLKSHEYRYVMTESQDLRGIDVALLYQKDKFKLLSHNYIRPDLGANERPTRDILHVTGLAPTKDTLDVMVVHSPSRSGGERESEWKRLLVAQRLRSAVDSLIAVRREARVIIMGDFNDYPENRSIREALGVRLLGEAFDDNALYHLFAGSAGYGSYKYQGEWGIFDHLIVSGKLLDSSARFHTGERHAGIVRLPFLLVEDEKFGGSQPFRTYNGMRYQGGYSDHLPVRCDFELFFD